MDLPLTLTSITPLLRHIAACQTATLPGDRLEWRIGAVPVGFLKPDFAEAFCGYFGTDARRSAGCISLAATASGRLNAAAAALAPQFGYAIRGEDFDVRAPDSAHSLAVLDRGAVPIFGVIGAGVHLNGVVRRADGLHLWIATRSASKKLDPGKFDNLVGGGVSAGLTPTATLAKEADEEAAIPAALIEKATLTAQIDYAMERPEGLRRDRLYCFDLVLPEHFTPRAADGEVESFALWPAKRILEVMLAGDDFKFNVNLVLIDWLIRAQFFAPDAASRLRSALAGSTG
jgi:8-oxo-dGTP pyrophosphatase MutT (NUDIX family)